MRRKKPVQNDEQMFCTGFLCYNEKIRTVIVRTVIG
nr:MAG TPA: adenosine monophosphate-protein hydrolase [Caudoviricetes sp.]